jgi:Leucine-rich repeat (LRR) protein
MKSKFTTNASTALIKAKDVHTFEEELKIEELKKTRETYDHVQKFFRTDIRGFFSVLSKIKRLSKLDLSNNKIHFFDIDPFHLQKTNGFSSLIDFNISNNLIREEIGILLVMNLPLIQTLNFQGNPLVKDRKSFESIEYEIFRNKNILLHNRPETFKERKLNSKAQFIGAVKPLKISTKETELLLAKKIRPITSDRNL